jgi:hypothetical protein
MGESHYLPEKGAIRLWIDAVEQQVRAMNHA